jgi:tRNA threonylcarbamoyladenosine biosynthesis protein TsaB
MNILTFDTASEKLSAAIRIESELFTITAGQGFKHSEKLLPAIDKLFEISGSSIDNIDLIGCTRGPGSFTGLRIGMATAKGLAYGKNIPMISVPTLDFYSYNLNFFDGAVLPVIDARKNRFYTALYSKGTKKSEYLDITAEEIEDLVKDYEKVLITGPHSDKFFERIGENKKFSSDPFASINKIDFLIDITEKLYYNGEVDSEGQGPVYIRKSDAEEAMIKGQ